MRVCSLAKLLFPHPYSALHILGRPLKFAWIPL
jgi:hypothetical protein